MLPNSGIYTRGLSIDRYQDTPDAVAHSQGIVGTFPVVDHIFRVLIPTFGDVANSDAATFGQAKKMEFALVYLTRKTPRCCNDCGTKKPGRSTGSTR